MPRASSMADAPGAFGSGRIARRLTAREQEIVDLYIAGKSRAEIGEALGLRPGTVGGHIGGAAIKLGLRKRTALAFAVALARRDERARGWVGSGA